MDYRYHASDSTLRYRGIAIVVVLHVLLAWVLISGTARPGLDALAKPLVAVVIQDVTIAPPAAPPPLPKEIKPSDTRVPKVEAPAPPFVPPPELPAAVTAVPNIVSTSTSIPTPPLAPVPVPATIAPSTPTPLHAASVQVVTPVAALPAPASPEMPAKPPAKTDIAISCPIQVAPQMPRQCARRP